MLKRLLVVFVFSVLLFVQCKDKEYNVDYDDEKIKLGYLNNNIIFENNLKYPVILDHMMVNDMEITNFIHYKVCDYVKYKDEVAINYNEKLNQIIDLTTIVLPGKKKIIKHVLKKGDEVLLEFYPVNYNFLSDNVYFINKTISSNEKKYKLFTDTDIKKMINTNSGLTNKNEMEGIMIYVKEYDALDDFLEETEFELE